LAIGDWQCLERTTDGVPIRLCAIPEKREQGRFALEVATHAIRFYDHWYGIKYPFGKLDMLAIPDYEWGGMENTASIFYRESAMLLDETTASVFTKRRQARVIAHEIAHQWFGDLVTPQWWDDVWLKEGFATWMAQKPSKPGVRTGISRTMRLLQPSRSSRWIPWKQRVRSMAIRKRRR
jgi:aminopeptidase N